MSDEPDVRQLTNVIRPASPERRPPEKLKLPRALHAGTITTMPSEARAVDKPKSPEGYKSIVAPVFDPINPGYYKTFPECDKTNPTRPERPVSLPTPDSTPLVDN